MRVSFDLDDTLISTTYDWAHEVETPPYRRGEDIEEYLRRGTVDLFRRLRRDGHEIWIYTNSYRGWKDLEQWFVACGCPVDRVINQVRHDEARMDRDPGFAGQKNPTWFDIDVHVDDSETILEMARLTGAHVVRVDPCDTDWVETVWAEVERYLAGRPRQPPDRR